MIELTEKQMVAIGSREASLPRMVNPRTKETFVLLRVDEYQRLAVSTRTRDAMVGIALPQSVFVVSPFVDSEATSAHPNTAVNFRE
jgi:hypothetical protein